MQLAIDTVHSACSVALANGKGTLVVSRHLEQKRGQAESLIPQIRDVLDDKNYALADIKTLLVTTGPGTFAGVRIGIAAARALALAGKIKCLGFTSFEFLATHALETEKPGKDARILCLMPGRRDEWAALIYIVGGGKMPLVPDKGPVPVTAKDLPCWAGKPPDIITGPPAEDAARFLFPENKGKVLARWPRAETLFQARKIFPDRAPEKTVRAFYFRPPDATPPPDK